MRLIILIITSTLLLACSKEKEDNINSSNTETTQNNQNDTIIPYSVTNCCDTNYIQTGNLDTAINFIASVVTPMGNDGYNDCFYIGYSSSATQQLTIEVKDSVGTIVFYDTNFSSNYNASFNRLLYCGVWGVTDWFYTEGMYDVKLSSITGTINMKLCIIINQCLPCYNSCKRIDYLDPQFL